MNEMKQTKKALLAFAVLLIAASVFVSAGAADEMPVNGTLTGDVTYTLKSGPSWDSIAHTLEADSTFDGQNHTITISDVKSGGTDISACALLGGVDLAGHDLTVQNVFITGSINEVGPNSATLIAYVKDSVGGGTLTIDNVHVKDSSFTTTADDSNISGIVGFAHTMERVVIKNCSIENSTFSSNAGIAGIINGANTVNFVDITNCRVEGCSLTSLKGNVGGIMQSKDFNSLTISNCKVLNSNIMGSSEGVGGIIYMTNLVDQYVITNCDVENSVIFGEGYRVGGIIGLANYLPHVTPDGAKINACRVINTVVCANAVVAPAGSVRAGGIAGFVHTYNLPIEIAGNTVDHCTIADMNGANNGLAGGVCANVSPDAKMSDNSVLNTCVVSVTGKAAGISPE